MALQLLGVLWVAACCWGAAALARDVVAPWRWGRPSLGECFLLLAILVVATSAAAFPYLVAASLRWEADVRATCVDTGQRADRLRWTFAGKVAVPIRVEVELWRCPDGRVVGLD